jgi:hypothetical protein
MFVKDANSEAWVFYSSNFDFITLFVGIRISFYAIDQDVVNMFAD